MGPGGKGPGRSPNPLFHSTENRTKFHIFPACCSTKTQDKVIKTEESVRLIFDLTHTWEDEKYGDDFIFSGLFHDKSLFLKNFRIFSRTKQNSRTFPGFPGFPGCV